MAVIRMLDDILVKFISLLQWIIQLIQWRRAFVCLDPGEMLND